MVNNKGQAVFVGLMLGVTVIVLALALIYPVKESISIARQNSTDTSIGLNCTQAGISNYDEAACLISDISLPYFIGGLIFIGGAIMVAKLMYEQ